MASQVPVLTISATAGADLSAKQFYLVKMSADDTVILCAAATDVPVGVLQNKPASGQIAEILTFGKSKIVSSASIAAGKLIGTSSAGKADAKIPGTDTTEYVVGHVTKAASADGVLLEALINTASPARAA